MKVRRYDRCHRKLLFYDNFQNVDTGKQKRKKSVERAFRVNRIQMKSGLRGWNIFELNKSSNNQYCNSLIIDKKKDAKCGENTNKYAVIGLS